MAVVDPTNRRGNIFLLLFYLETFTDIHYYATT